MRFMIYRTGRGIFPNSLEDGFDRAINYVLRPVKQGFYYISDHLNFSSKKEARKERTRNIRVESDNLDLTDRLGRALKNVDSLMATLRSRDGQAEEIMQRYEKLIEEYAEKTERLNQHSNLIAHLKEGPKKKYLAFAKGIASGKDLENIPAGVVDSHETVVYANKSLLKVLGLKEKDVINQPWSNFVLGGDDILSRYFNNPYAQLKQVTLNVGEGIPKMALKIPNVYNLGKRQFHLGTYLELHPIEEDSIINKKKTKEEIKKEKEAEKLKKGAESLIQMIKDYPTFS